MSEPEFSDRQKMEIIWRSRKIQNAVRPARWIKEGQTGGYRLDFWATPADASAYLPLAEPKHV